MVLAPTVLQDTWCREVAAVSTARFAAVKRGTSAKTMRTLNDANFVFVSHRMLVSGNAYALNPAIHWPYIICKYTADGMCSAAKPALQWTRPIKFDNRQRVSMLEFGSFATSTTTPKCCC